MSLSPTPDGRSAIWLVDMTVTPAMAGASSDQRTLLKFDTPVTVNAGQVYTLTLALSDTEIGFWMHVDRWMLPCRPPLSWLPRPVPGPDQCLLQIRLTLYPYHHPSRKVGYWNRSR